MQHIKNLTETQISNIPLAGYISIIHRTHMMHLNHEMKDLNITAGQFPFLMELYRKEGITQDDMAGHFHIDKGTVARALKKMEDNEIIYRQIDPKNRRRHLIFLTQKGKKAVCKIKDIDKEWENRVLDGLSTSERKELLRTLKVLAVKSMKNARENGVNYHEC
ncbi:MAG: MarR family transcriptional regulator [Methanobacteriaceae archaeon]|nr:MarR family transcriptional regulator [Methanobacteriaceae archaeon]